MLLKVYKNVWHMPDSCLTLHPPRLTHKNVKYFAVQDVVKRIYSTTVNKYGAVIQLLNEL